MDGVALRATTNPAAWRIAWRRLASSIPRSASRRCLDSREISGAPLRVSPCRRTRKAAFAAHETSRKVQHGLLVDFVDCAADGVAFIWIYHSLAHGEYYTIIYVTHYRDYMLLGDSARMGVRVLSCAAKAAFVSRRGEGARMGGGDAPPSARLLALRSASREGGSLKSGGGKSPPDRQRRSGVAPGFVVARSAAPSTKKL